MDERLWVVEALLGYRDESDGAFPSWAELVEFVNDMAGMDDGERRIWEALRRQEVTIAFDDYADATLKLGPHSFTNAPPWLRNHPWTRKEYS